LAILSACICLFGQYSLVWAAVQACDSIGWMNLQILRWQKWTDKHSYWHNFRNNRRKFDLFVYKSEKPLKQFFLNLSCDPSSFKLQLYCTEYILYGSIFPSMNQHGLLASFLMGKIFWNC
jgi:hypothetical protein